MSIRGATNTVTYGSAPASNCTWSLNGTEVATGLEADITFTEPGYNLVEAELTNNWGEATTERIIVEVIETENAFIDIRMGGEAFTGQNSQMLTSPDVYLYNISDPATYNSFTYTLGATEGDSNILPYLSIHDTTGGVFSPRLLHVDEAAIEGLYIVSITIVGTTQSGATYTAVKQIKMNIRYTDTGEQVVDWVDLAITNPSHTDADPDHSSGNWTPVGDTLQLELDNLLDAANPDAVDWDMGDGTTYADQNSVEHQYDSAGNYEITGTIKGSTGNAVVQDVVTVSNEPAKSKKSLSNLPLTADFETPNNGFVVVNDLTAVDDELDTPPAHVAGERYLIDATAVGDWAGHENQIAESDGAGTWTYSRFDFEGMTVYDNDSTAYKHYSHASTDVIAGVASVGFTNKTPKNGRTLTYAWTFGDAGSATDYSPVHAYTTLGAFTITLTVTDTNTGEVSAVSKTIQVGTDQTLNTMGPALELRIKETRRSWPGLVTKHGKGQTNATVAFIISIGSGSDIIQMTADYGDGNEEIFTLDDPEVSEYTVTQGGKYRSFKLTHSYSVMGVYPLKITVKNNYGIAIMQRDMNLSLAFNRDKYGFVRRGRRANADAYYILKRDSIADTSTILMYDEDGAVLSRFYDSTGMVITDIHPVRIDPY